VRSIKYEKYISKPMPMAARRGLALVLDDFYNEERPHQAMDNQMPMPCARRHGKDRSAGKNCDMPLRLDNANALPTYPQRQQHQAEAA